MGVDDLADQHEADSARRLMSLLMNVSDAEFRDRAPEALPDPKHDAADGARGPRRRWSDPQGLRRYVIAR